VALNPEGVAEFSIQDKPTHAEAWDLLADGTESITALKREGWMVATYNLRTRKRRARK
jgi:hypothetical protein